MVKIAAFEDGIFIGVVLFARGSNKHLGLPFGLTQFECVELVRVALSEHVVQTSRVISIACRMLKMHSDGVRLVISFANTAQGHHGGIYQAAGWIYSGVGSGDERSRPYRAPDRTIKHWRTVAGALSKRGMKLTIEAAKSIGYEPLEKYPKHRYLMPLDAEMRARILPLAKPYPKRTKDQASALQADLGSETLTRPLQLSQVAG